MVDDSSIIVIMFLIFAGAAVISTAALYARQSLLVAYILLGVILGPGLKLLYATDLIQQTGHVGVIFLLFLLGLHLDPKNLLKMLAKVSWITLISSIIFAGISFIITRFFGYSITESVIIAISMMFSSTIIGLKLLPTTVLHHQHTGELMISILLMQDIIAIVVLLFLEGAANSSISVWALLRVIIALPVLLCIAYFAQRYVIIKLLRKFDRFQEYVFLLSIGWCLSLAILAQGLGLSAEIGAFTAGVALATNPISFHIAESLKPLRDFFLVIFFFSVGADFSFSYLPAIFFPALILSAVVLFLKPPIFRLLISPLKEAKHVSWEVAVRLSQASEFSLLVTYLAESTRLIGEEASNLVQAVTVVTFIISSYWVIAKYPTPMGVSDQLRKD